MDFGRGRGTRLSHKLPELDRRASALLLVAGLLAILAAMACQGELPDTTSAQPERELPATVMTGDEFWVTVNFTSPKDGFHGIALTDLAPAGWNVSVNMTWTEPQAMVGHTPESETVVYIWEGPHDAGVEFTAAYKIQVPVDAEPGAYTFSGSIEYYIEPYPEPSHKEDIAGDTRVTVSQDLQPYTDELFYSQVGIGYGQTFAVSSGTLSFGWAGIARFPQLPTRRLCGWIFGCPFCIVSILAWRQTTPPFSGKSVRS